MFSGAPTGKTFMCSNQRNFFGFHLGPGYYLGLYPEEGVVQKYLRLIVFVLQVSHNFKRSANVNFEILSISWILRENEMVSSDM